jgi:hypothetical protein
MSERRGGRAGRGKWITLVIVCGLAAGLYGLTLARFGLILGG